MSSANKTTMSTGSSATKIARGASTAPINTGLQIETPGDLMKIAYRVSEATAVTGLSRSSLYIAIQSGTLRVKKCGRRTLILQEDLVDFLQHLPSQRS